MIKAVLFDLGGTLHKSSSPPFPIMGSSWKAALSFWLGVWPLTARSISMNPK